MKVELSLHASKLQNVAGMGKGKSDPFAVVTQLAMAQGEKPTVLGKTEVIKNTLSPHWVKSFTFDYEMGTPIQVAVTVMDEVRKGKDKNMGSAVFRLDELLGARGNTKAKKLGKKGGTVFACLRKSEGAGVLRLSLKGSKLKNVEGWIGKSDPFYEISRKINTPGGLTWDNVFRSEVMKNNLNPVWKPATMELAQVCGGDLDAPILVAVFDYESKGKHVAMGSFETSVNGLVQAGKRNEAFTLKQKGKAVGTIHVANATIAGHEQQAAAAAAAAPTIEGRMAATTIAPSAPVAPAAVVPMAAPPVGSANFVDYVSGGCQLHVVVGIDFTGSNGDPRKPGTLHYINKQDPTFRNDYEKAIASILSILAPYDSDQMFPVFGFGAKYGGVIQHCFQCGPSAEVHGVQGVLDAYRGVFRSGLVMSGPTDITPILQYAGKRARDAQDAAAASGGGQAYTILLLITDGAVSDVNQTAAVLNQVAESPLSVVMVGVGGADFAAMHFLDGAAHPGTPDIASFVSFRDHSRNSADLTKATLREVPDQLVHYYQKRSIAPRPPQQSNDDEIVVEAEEEEIDLSIDINEDEEIVVSGGDGFVDGFNASR